MTEFSLSKHFLIRLKLVQEALDNPTGNDQRGEYEVSVHQHCLLRHPVIYIAMEDSMCGTSGWSIVT